MDNQQRPVITPHATSGQQAVDNITLPCSQAPTDNVTLEVESSALGEHIVLSIVTEELPASASTPMLYLTLDNAKALYVWLWHAIKELEG